MDDYFKRPAETVWVDVHATKRETGKAMLLTTEAGDIWVPRSQMKARKTNEHGDLVRLELPAWLAEEKGLADPKDTR